MDDSGFLRTVFRSEAGTRMEADMTGSRKGGAVMEERDGGGGGGGGGGGALGMRLHIFTSLYFMYTRPDTGTGTPVT